MLTNVNDKCDKKSKLTECRAGQFLHHTILHNTDIVHICNTRKLVISF